MTQTAAQQTANLPMPRWEFIALVASLLAMTAAAIDTMLPALGVIGDYFQLENANDQQMVIYGFLMGFSVPQLFFGPLSDRFGRIGLLKALLICFVLLSIACMFAPGFWALVGLRVLQGMVSGGIRVISVAIVRDLLEGRGMASVMSLIMTVFMIVPILAPILGAEVMEFSWRWTFGVLVIHGAINWIWVSARLPETLPSERRRPLNVKKFMQAYLRVLSYRETVGYLLASGVIYGSLFAFLGASEQIFDEVFHKGHNFAYWFAGVAFTMAITSYANSKWVEKYGMRRISHLAIFAFAGFSILNLILMKTFGEVFVLFYPLLALTMGCFGMVGANFNALAMQPHGNDSGSASAAYGFATTGLATVIGYLIARQYDGSVLPILWGFVLLALTCCVILAITERGEFFGNR